MIIFHYFLSCTLKSPQLDTTHKQTLPSQSYCQFVRENFNFLFQQNVKDIETVNFNNMQLKMANYGFVLCFPVMEVLVGFGDIMRCKIKNTGQYNFSHPFPAVLC